MKRFVEGEERRQSLLLPDSLDHYVTEDNPVRVVEVFIDELDLGALGFEGMQPAATGRPAYRASTMLKIYLYGYLNRVQSSRRLDRAPHFRQGSTTTSGCAQAEATVFEEVAAKACVSKALMYKHFADRVDLLRASAAREYDILRGRGIDRPQRAGLSLQEAIRLGNVHAFQNLHDRGPLLRMIFSDPALAKRFGGQDREERGGMTRHYAWRIAPAYAVPEDLAFMVTLLTINAAFGAGRALKRYEVYPKEAADHGVKDHGTEPDHLPPRPSRPRHPRPAGKAERPEPRAAGRNGLGVQHSRRRSGMPRDRAFGRGAQLLRRP